MEALDSADQYLAAGLAALGVEADEIELAVIGATHSMIWPAVLALLELDASEAPDELAPDLSQPPPAARAAGEPTEATGR